MLFKYSGKYVNIYFNMKITYPTCCIPSKVHLVHIWLVEVRSRATRGS